MANDNRITRDMVVAENLVDRYLLGKMDEAEAMAFEDFYASDPETLAELETSALLIDGMQQAGRSGELPAATPGRTVVPLRARVRRFFASPAYGIAASFVALAAVVLLIVGKPGDTDRGGAVAATNFPVVTLAATRGGDAGLEVTANAADQVVFVLDLGIADEPAYRATLRDAGGETVWQAGGLRPDALQSLTVTLPGTLLPAGAYQFAVRPDGAGDETLRFPFVIDRE